MTYVEWLRARSALKVLAIIFGVLLVLAGIMRIWVATVTSHDTFAWIHGIELDRSSHVSRLTLPDGTRRVVVDNAGQEVHIVIDDHGYQGKQITIVERSPERSQHSHDTISVGPVNVQTERTGQATVTKIETNQPEDFGYYAGIATFVTLIVATILGAPFARENDGHLEIALTKPISRTALALATIGTDALGLLGAWVLTIVFCAVSHALFQAPHFAFGPQDARVIGIGWLAIAAWYAMLCAATASMRRAYGVILGLAWPIAAIVFVLGSANLGESLIGKAVHAVAKTLSWIDPFSYMHFGPAFIKNGESAGAMAVSPQHDIPGLVILALVYGALAIIQWRRMEA